MKPEGELLLLSAYQFSHGKLKMGENSLKPFCYADSNVFSVKSMRGKPCLIIHVSKSLLHQLPCLG